MGWLIISGIALVLLAVEAVVSTFFILILLNGYTSLPDAISNIYLACTCGLLPALSLAAGFSAKKISEISQIPLWLVGSMAVGIMLVIVPIVLFVLTFVLLGAFGML
ncbi:MAG: hypothetical protein CVU44_07720 [Chloroflexi bacterium HGW-Chloroflexi-6]|nr:MAG: hypothetical protein CVU44_07720 [Chloroflexi bacterium HGW-Chloroflexi-6]